MSLCESLALVAGGEFAGKMCLGGRGVQTGRLEVQGSDPGCSVGVSSPPLPSPHLPLPLPLRGFDSPCTTHHTTGQTWLFMCAVLPHVTWFM